MTKELAEGFICANSANDLWDEIVKRYGQMNGPLLYQIQHELTTLRQGSASVNAYYNKIKKL